MLKDVKFDVRRDAPGLDQYRREWTPGPDATLAGMWLGGIVTDANGQNYFGLRGADDFVRGMIHPVSPTCGFRALQRGMTPNPPHLYTEYASVDFFEPLQYSATADKIQMMYGSGIIERSAKGLRWSDASGRWKLRGETVSDIVTVCVPQQEGIEHAVYYRHELLYAHGKVNGIEVSGYLHQDYAYGPPDMIYSELPIARLLQGMWVSWLHDMGNGNFGGGCFWQGKGGLSFGPGYLLKNGVTTTHKDITTKAAFNEIGMLTGLDVVIGDDAYSFAFDMMGTPIHFFGEVKADTSGQRPTRSWVWVENSGVMLTPELLDMAARPFALARGV